MDTLLLEKNRIADELTAFDFALEGASKQQELRGTLHGLKQRRDLAKDLGAKWQADLFELEIVRAERAYRVRHENPYPECSKTDAMDAMCEPIAARNADSENFKRTLNEDMRNALSGALRAIETLEARDQNQMLQNSVNRMQAYQTDVRLMGAMQAGAYFGLDPRMSAAWQGYSPQTHKYDLACETLNLVGQEVEGSLDTEVMLPMSALCRLKEAKEKNLFDHFEVWRPSEWKAPDPWLVGVWYEDKRHAKSHYFKVCDWR